MMPTHPGRRGDDRRRRLLQEEIVAADARSGDASAGDGTERPTRRKRARYAKAADMHQQPRVTDLVPSRKLTLSLLFLLGLAAIAGLEALYAWMPSMAKITSDGRIAAFDLDGEGSLAAWFSSAMLALAALTAVLIYSLRRHRLDDYRARYRIWLWAAACWLVMSIDEAGSLHEGFKEMMAYLTGERLYGDGSLWWVIAYGSVLGLLGLLLLWDMRECRFSTTSLVVCGLCYAVAVVTQLELILPARGARAVMLEEGCEMLGNLFLLLAMATHARYLIRDIQGLTNKPAKRKARKATKPAANSTRTKTSPEKAEKPSMSSAKVQEQTETSVSSKSRKLSKAERRAARNRGK